jgi:hypothetical protein
VLGRRAGHLTHPVIERLASRLLAVCGRGVKGAPRQQSVSLRIDSPTHRDVSGQREARTAFDGEVVSQLPEVILHHRVERRVDHSGTSLLLMALLVFCKDRPSRASTSCDGGDEAGVRSCEAGQAGPRFS